MRIRISETPSKGFSLRLPTKLLLNPLTAPILSRQLKKHGVNLSAKSLRLLIKAVGDYQKTHPDWLLVEVDSAKGERVEIRL